MKLRGSEGGFTFIGLLIFVVIMGIGLAAAGELWSTAAKREKEAQLLFVGDEFRRAIGSYYEGSQGLKQFPRELEDLLEDKRFPMVRRYLRQIYRDPMTDTANWGLVKSGDSIIGVHSLSEDKPLKTGNFKSEDEAFSAASTYADWQFTYVPGSASPQPSAQNAPGRQPPAQNSPGTQLPAPFMPSKAP
jgi:type II secretory pathway pseudopilin PulG